MDNCQTVCQNREYTAAALANMGFSVLPSKTNFLFAKSNVIDGRELYEKLKAQGILVRHFNTERISAFVRVTIGTKTQMDAFLQAVAEIIKEKQV
jgi:histidinol-phosphate aminotransferase